MSSPSPNENAETTPEFDIFGYPKIPKLSWETQTQCDESFKEMPTYSWEFDTCSPIHKEDSNSTIVPDSQCSPNIHHIPNWSWESASQCDKAVQPYQFTEPSECPDQKRVVKAVQPYQFAESSYTYGGSTSNEGKDQYYDLICAQSPEKPNLNLDVDAIESVLCDGFLDSPPQDHYYDLICAQSPDKPNINLDVDAIKRELCDGFVDSPVKKKRERTSLNGSNKWKVRSGNQHMIVK